MEFNSSEAVMSELTFELLGPVSARRGAQELDLGSPQQRAVLAVLLLARGRHVAMDMLVDALWGDRPPRTAATTIRNYVSRLRRCLHPGPGWPDQDVIRLVGDGYTLRLGEAVLDLDVFERLTQQARAARADGETALAAELFRQAQALWRGIPLAGVQGPYADAQRARLAELRLAAAQDGLAAEVDSGQHAAAVAQLQELVADYPLRERLTELLMLALYRSGRQADALAVFDRARRRLRDELGIDPGPALRQTQQRILEADGRLTPPAGPEPRPGLAALTQLPATLADFTGRAAELAAVTAALTGTTALTGTAEPPVVAICGMPGIGKTALAVRAARAVAGAFPDGQLFAELTEPGDLPTDPASVLGGFLRALGTGPVPASLFERAAAWRSALAGRRMVIVLDDVHSAAQVRRLLPPPPGCAVIITSRQSLLDLPGVRCVEVGRLAPGEATELLGRLVGAGRVAAERAAAERLVAACAWQPLAIRTAGARLAARPAWQITAMEAQLQLELREPVTIHADCELVEAPFESAHGRLSPEAALAFRQAAAAPGLEISVPAMSAALNLPEHIIRALLDALADVHLIEADSVSGQFRYDPLLKLYARRKAMAVDSPAVRPAIPA
jgi:DNA-binding SARP family transcriptional activator